MIQPTYPALRHRSAGLVTALLFFVLAACGGDLPEAEAAEGFRTMTVAHVAVDLVSGAPLVILRDGWDEVFPIWIGEPEAAAILQVLDEQALPRPMTHDLAVSILSGLGGTLLEARVTSLEASTYLGRLFLRGAEGPYEVDARPSDAIALALRTGAPVRVAEVLLDDLPEVGFLTVGERAGVARLRGLTVGGSDSDRVEVLHVNPLEAGRGLRVGDQITRVEGQRVRSAADLVRAFAGRSSEGAVELERERDGATETVRLPARRAPVVSG